MLARNLRGDTYSGTGNGVGTPPFSIRNRKGLVMKKALLALAAISVVATSALAVAPPGGWGTDFTNWQEYQDTGWGPIQMAYNGSGAFLMENGNEVVWPGFELELWIEAECTASWDHFSVRAHRMADYSNFEVIFNGHSSCNLPIYVQTTAPSGADPLTHLMHRHGVGNAGGTMIGGDIPLTWEYRVLGVQPWTVVNPIDDGRMVQFQVPACDQDFDIRITGEMEYHQKPGYYQLGGEGYHICPLGTL